MVNSAVSSSFPYRRAVVGLALAFAAGSGLASDSFTLLNYLGTTYATVSGISPDGSVAYGWVHKKGEPLGAPIPAWFDGKWHLSPVKWPIAPYLQAISADNLTLVGSYEFTLSNAWTLKDGIYSSLGTPSTAVGIKADRSKIVGHYLFNNPCLWTNGVPAELTVPAGVTDSRAVAMSSSGSMIVGMTGDFRPIVWEEGTPSLPTYSGYESVHFTGVSRDGKTIVGSAVRSGGPAQGQFPVVIKSGVLSEYARELLLNRPEARSDVAGISDDGSIAYGWQNDARVIWDKQGYMYDPTELLRALGLLPAHVESVEVNGLSANGNQIAGVAVLDSIDAYGANYAPPFSLHLENRAWPNIVNPISGLTHCYFNDHFTAEVRLSRPAPKGGTTLYVDSTDTSLSFRKVLFVPSGKTSALLSVKVGNPSAGDMHRESALLVTSPDNAVTTKFWLTNLAPQVTLGTPTVKGGQDITGRLIAAASPIEDAAFVVSSSDEAAVPSGTTVTLRSGEGSANVLLHTNVVSKRETVTLRFKYRAFTVVKKVVLVP